MLKSIFILTIFVVANQIVKAQEQEIDEHSVNAIYANGTCFCDVESPSHVVCSDFEADIYENIATAIFNVDILKADLSIYEKISVEIQEEITLLSAETQDILTIFAQMKEERKIIVKGKDLYDLELQILVLLERLELLEVNQTVSQELLDEIKFEINLLTTYMDSLEEVDSTVMRDLEVQVKELTTKLDECESRVVITPVPLEPCVGGLVKVHGDPLSHRVMSTAAGAWMTDSIQEDSRVFAMHLEYSSRYGRYLYEYSNLENFEQDIQIAKRDLYPGFSNNYFQGTGHVVYNGSLYANRYNTRDVYRISTANWAKTGSITIPNAGYTNAYSYEVGYYTDIDMAADEIGLWVIYATAETSGRIVISKIDEESFLLKQTFYTTYVKKEAGSCVMICGVLYCTDDPFSHEASFVYFYDTQHFTEGNINIPFDNKFGKVTSLDYNPRELKFYAWDNTVTTTYGVDFGP